MSRAIAFLGMLLLMAAYGCGDDPEAKVGEKTEGKRVKEVGVSRVKALPPKGSIEYVGILTAYRKASVSNETGGTIEKLCFEKGDRVKRGRLLAEIGTSSVRLQVREAKAAVEATKFRLKKMEKGSRPQEIRIAEAAVREAKAGLVEAEKNYNRIKQLHEIEAISGSKYDGAERQVFTAKARMESAEHQLALTLKGPRIEDIRTSRANLGQAEAGMAMANDRLKKSIIRAPCDGIIAFRNVEEGEVIRAGTPITRIIDLKRMKIEVSLGEKDLYVLEGKDEFSFSVDAIPGEKFRCRFFFLSPTADSATRSFPAEFIINEPDRRMADGMTVRIGFPAVAQGKRIKIPSAWLSEEDGKIGLYVVKEGKALFKEVKMGAYYDNRVEILSDLGSEALVITNPSGLQTGDPVRCQESQGLRKAQ